LAAEAIMARTSSEDSFIKSEIQSALGRAGLPPDHRIGEILDFNSGVAPTGRDFVVRCDGGTLDQKIAELRKNPRYFPQPSASVDHRDLNKLSESFADIASGKVTVE
jgi:hypothetical protein